MEIGKVTCNDDRLVRPVRCFFCNEAMFYAGDERHVPEVRIEVHGDEGRTDFYAHVPCWNDAIRYRFFSRCGW